MLETLLFIISTILGFLTGYSVIRFIMFPVERIINKNIIEVLLTNMSAENMALEKHYEYRRNKLNFHLKYSIIVFLFDILTFMYGNLTGFWIGFAVSATIFSFFLIAILLTVAFSYTKFSIKIRSNFLRK